MGGDRFLGGEGGVWMKIFDFFQFFSIGSWRGFGGWGGSDQKKSKKVVENRKTKLNNSIGKNDPKCQKNGVEIGRKPHADFGIEIFRKYFLKLFFIFFKFYFFF